MSKLSFHETNEIVALGGEVRIIPERLIKRIYCLYYSNYCEK